MLAPFEDATTPRNFSPCGITLDRNGPVLCKNPERFYEWISDANIVVPEVLLVPLYRNEEPIGTLWVVSDSSGHFDSGDARVLTELASFVSVALRVAQAEMQLHTALEEQQLLAGEMEHRIKNLFAMADSMIRMSTKGASTKEDLAQSISGRLRALSSANSLVRSNSGEGSPGETSLNLLLEKIVNPYEVESGEKSRFFIEGPSLLCTPRTLNGIALIFHELTTNAVKHGALVNDQGHVDVCWFVEGENLVVHWTEHGGPPILSAPLAKGFGSTLLNNTITGQFSGSLNLDWATEGLHATLSMPVSKLAA